MADEFLSIQHRQGIMVSTVYGIPHAVFTGTCEVGSTAFIYT